jgi:DNA-binding MarR family transcriptional regulator
VTLSEPIGPLASTGYWLKVGALAWQRELDARLRSVNLTTPQFNVLAAVGWLGYSGQPPTQQEAADFAGTDRMMTSKLLRTLEGEGLVERVSDASDARVRRVRLTDPGRTASTRSTALARDVDRDFFGTDVTLRDALRSVFQPDTGPAH